MASLKQTKIYGALEVYNGKNKVNITVDPKNYPNGIMSIGRINFDGITVYNAGSALGIVGDISTNSVSSISLNTGTITASKITGLSTLTFTGNTGSISGVHSIAFDGTGSGISNLHGLTFTNPSGTIYFKDHKITIGSFTGSQPDCFKMLNSSSNCGGIYLGNYAGSSESGVKLKWDANASLLNIDKPIIIDDGLSLQKTSISNLESLSFSKNSNTAELKWTGTYLSLGDQTYHISIAKDKIEVGAGTNDHNKSTLTSTKIENVYSGTTETSTVTIEKGKILIDEKNDNIVIGADGATFNDTTSGKKSTSNIAIGTSSTVSMKGDNGIFIGVGSSIINADSSNTIPGIGIGFRPNIEGGIGIGVSADAGNGSIAIGNNAKVSKTESVGGLSSTTTLYSNGIAIGSNTIAGESAIAIGNGAKVGLDASAGTGIVGGFAPVADGIAIGKDAICSSATGIALGTGASCSTSNSLELPSEYKVYADGLITTSDKQDKTDIKNLTNKYTPFLMDLEPVTYRFNYRNNYTVENPDPKFRNKYGISEYDKITHAKATKANSRIHVGFIAQDVKSTIEKHFPNNDHLDIVNIDKMDTGEFQKGEIESGYERYYMNYNSMIPVLVKVLQEQQEEINILKSEIEKLKK